MPDVVIVGGGVIGLSTAREVARRGLTVTVLEQGQFGREASWAGAGILPAGPTRDTCDPLDQLAAATVRLWPALSAGLLDRTGIDNGFRRCGGIALAAHPDDDAPAEVDYWRQAGIEHQSLTPAELQQLEPALRCAGRSAPYLVPAVAQIRNPRHLQALLADCAALGVELRSDEEVVGFEQRAERMTSARTTDALHAADHFVVAGGAWSTRLMADSGVRLDIEPVRGQMVLLNAHPPPFHRVIECGPRYLVPRDDGRILVGSTEEWVGFEKRNTAEAVSSLLEFATSIVPSLRDARFETAWSGLRPHARRGRPYIGRVIGFDNLCIAAGHFRSGLYLSPITARLITELIVGEPLEFPLDAFGVNTNDA
jgi:glycine oxidase